MATNKTRKVCGWVYFGLGCLALGTILIVSVTPVWNWWIRHWVKIIWCLGWALLGIGAGLINTRNHGAGHPESPKRKAFHYIGYCPFVLVIATLLSVFVGLYLPNQPLQDAREEFFLISALVALSVGFLEDRLHGLLLSWLSWTRGGKDGNKEKGGYPQPSGTSAIRKPDTLIKWLAPLVAVTLFWLGQHYERRKEAAAQSRYNNQAILALKNELSENFSNINNMRDILTKDLVDLTHGKVAITPLIPFQFTAWEQARFGRADFLLKADTADYMKLKNCYLILRILQEKVKNREQNRLHFEGNPVFVQRMTALDHDIIDKLEHTQVVVKQAQDYLDAIHQWVVKGDSFDVDRGLVVEFQN